MVTMECPFTWEINDNLVRNFDENSELTVDYNEQPVLSVMNSIMITYCRTVKGDYNNAKIKMDETIEIWNQIDQSEIEAEEISVSVLLHIMKATEFYLLKATGDISEAKKIMNDIEDSKRFKTDLELGTIFGCKGIAWSTFHEASHETTTFFAKQAVSKSPNCPLWHFVLGKSLRHSRRHGDFKPKLSPEEERSLLRCRELSDKPFYMIHVAHMLGAKKNYGGSKSLYQECLEKLISQNIPSVGLLLRLAQIFMKNKDFVRAKRCLDYAEMHAPENSMFLHYKGMFFEKTNNLKEAAIYFEKAAKYGNYGADVQLALCAAKLDRRYDSIKHFERMLEKYVTEYYQQQTLLHLGMLYYIKSDFVKASVHFLKAIELNPKNNWLKNYKNMVGDWKEYNIFNFIYDKLLPMLNGSSRDEDNYEKLKNMCERYKYVN